MPRKAKAADPPNPLPCGCAAMGRPTINWDGTRMEHTGIHVVHCPLHAAAADLLAALRLALPCIGSNDMVYSQGDHGKLVYVRDAVVAAIARAEVPAP